MVDFRWEVKIRSTTAVVEVGFSTAASVEGGGGFALGVTAIDSGGRVAYAQGAPKSFNVGLDLPSLPPHQFRGAEDCDTKLTTHATKEWGCGRKCRIARNILVDAIMGTVSLRGANAD